MITCVFSSRHDSTRSNTQLKVGEMGMWRGGGDRQGRGGVGFWETGWGVGGGVWGNRWVEGIMRGWELGWGWGWEWWWGWGGGGGGEGGLNVEVWGSEFFLVTFNWCLNYWQKINKLCVTFPHFFPEVLSWNIIQLIIQNIFRHQFIVRAFIIKSRN